MRRAAALALAAAAGVAVCTVALAADGQPRKAFRSADQALARSIELRRSDLPAGFTAGPGSSGEGEVPRCKGFKPDESDLTLVGRASSPDFDKSGNPPLISSAVDVWLTTAQARADFQRVVRPGLDACLSSVIGKALTASAPKGVRYLPVSHTLKSLSGLGQQAATVRLVFTGVSGGSRIPFVVDYYAIRKHRVTALVTTVDLRASYAAGPKLAATVASRIP